MQDIIDVERIDGDLWIVCNDTNVLMIEDDEAVELAKQLLKNTSERIGNVLLDVQALESSIKAARVALYTAGYCGDGNLADMVTRGLVESQKRGHNEAQDEIDKMSSALIEASSAFPDEMVGTVADRVKILAEEREFLRRLLREWAIARDLNQDKNSAVSASRYEHVNDELFKYVCAAGYLE